MGFSLLPRDDMDVVVPISKYLRLLRIESPCKISTFEFLEF